MRVLTGEGRVAWREHPAATTVTATTVTTVVTRRGGVAYAVVRRVCLSRRIRNVCRRTRRTGAIADVRRRRRAGAAAVVVCTHAACARARQRFEKKKYVGRARDTFKYCDVNASDDNYSYCS